MNFSSKKVKFLGERTLKAKNTGNPFRLATFFDEATYTKVDLFCADEFSSQGIENGTDVEIEVKISDRGNLSVVNIVA